MDPLRFRLSSASLVDGTCVVTLSGELDLANVEEIDRELETLHERGARKIVVDLLEVPFVESRVLGVLLRHSSRLRESGGRLTLVIDDRVLRVIELTGLRAQFRIAATLAEAIAEELAAAGSP